MPWFGPSTDRHAADDRLLSYASPLTERELLDSAPKPVSIFDSRVHLRIPLDQRPKTVPSTSPTFMPG